MKKHQYVRQFVALSVLLLQLLFLSFTLSRQHINVYVVGALVLGVLLLVLIGYKNLKLHDDDYFYESLGVIFWIPIGAVVCYFLNNNMALGSVLAAGIVGVLASFLPMLNKQSGYLKKLPAPIYCGAFVGMSDELVATSFDFVLVAGVWAGIFYRLSHSMFLGVGGKLGTIAFGGVVVSSVLYWMVL